MAGLDDARAKGESAVEAVRVGMAERALGSIGLNALQLLAYEHPIDGKPDTRQNPVSIVFTDLEGFTRFTSRHGDDAALSLLADHHRVIGPIVRSRGGKVVKRLGDGLMLSFPSAESAVLAALELLDVPPDELRLRAGVHAGEAAAAKGGQVLATVAVRDAVGDLRGVTFGRARRRSFKGVEQAVQVCPVQRSG